MSIVYLLAGIVITLLVQWILRVLAHRKNDKQRRITKPWPSGIFDEYGRYQYGRTTKQGVPR